MTMIRIRQSWLFAAIVVASALFVFAAGLAQPRHNFDMVGYVAAAHHKDGLRGVPLWQRTYGDVFREVSPETFSELVAGSSYRAAVYASPESLTQHLPFYSIRVAYVEMMRLLKRAGLSYPQASYLLSAAFAALAVLVLGCLLARLGLPAPVLPVVVYLGKLTDLAQHSTPDALVCLAALSLVLLLLERKRLVFVLAALMPLLRTDFILLSLIVLALAFVQISRPQACLSLLAAFAAYFWVNHAAGNYGYLTIFNFTLIARHPFPAEMPISTDPKDYLDAYLAGARAFVSSKHFLLYSAAAVLFVLKARKGRLEREDQALVVPALLFVAAHMALFPANLQRFFVFAVCLTMLWLVAQARKELQLRGFSSLRRAAG